MIRDGFYRPYTDFQGIPLKDREHHTLKAKIYLFSFLIAGGFFALRGLHQTQAFQYFNPRRVVDILGSLKQSEQKKKRFERPASSTHENKELSQYEKDAIFRMHMRALACLSALTGSTFFTSIWMRMMAPQFRWKYNLIFSGTVGSLSAGMFFVPFFCLSEETRLSMCPPIGPKGRFESSRQYSGSISHIMGKHADRVRELTSDRKIYYEHLKAKISRVFLTSWLCGARQDQNLG